MCVIGLWCAYGTKLYPCSPEYVTGTPAAIAASCCCCTPGGHPSTGIWYPAGMPRVLSRMKFPNPVCDAGMFPACQLIGVDWRLHPPASLYIDSTAGCQRESRGGGGCRGRAWIGLTDSCVEKTHRLSLGLNPIKEALRCSF